MNLYKYTYQGETYEFRMSNKARLAIEEIQQNALKGLADPEVASVASCYLNEYKDESKTEEEKNIEVIMKLAPCADKLSKIDGDIDPVEVGYILLHSLSKYRSLTHEMYDEMIEAMEEEKGFEEVQTIFREMKEKVFTVMAALGNQKKKGPNQKRMSQKKVMN